MHDYSRKSGFGQDRATLLQLALEARRFEPASHAGGDVHLLVGRLTRHSTRPTLALDFSLLLTSRAGVRLAAALAGLVVVRALSPAEYGRYVLALTTIGLVAQIVDLGLNPILSREVAQQPGEATSLLAAASALRLLASLAAIVIAAALGALWPGFGDPLLLVLAGLALAPRGVLRARSATWLGLGKTPRAARLDAADGLLVALAVVLAAIVTGRAGVALLAASLASFVVAIVVLRPDVRPIASLRPERWRALLGAGTPLMVAGLAGVGFHALDLYVVG